MITRKRLILAGGIAVVLFVIANVASAAARAATYGRYWQDKRNEPAAPNAIRLVALGDSAVMAIGADRPMDGFVGRTAQYLETGYGRPVHISNVSSGGATTGTVLRDQLPLVDLPSADIVMVANPTDVEQRTPLDKYRRDLRSLINRLPADRTVFSDLPLMPGRDAYQAVLREETDARAIMRADFGKVLGEKRRLDVFSWLPPHLNSRGYGYWFEAFQPAVDRIPIAPR
jgi:hypothetical protein